MDKNGTLKESFPLRLMRDPRCGFTFKLTCSERYNKYMPNFSMRTNHLLVSAEQLVAKNCHFMELLTCDPCVISHKSFSASNRVDLVLETRLSSVTPAGAYVHIHLDSYGSS